MYSRFACILAMVAVIIASLSPNGLQVLCVGDDGHHAIEMAHQFAACETVATIHDFPSDNHAVIRADGSGCIDFGLGLDFDARLARVHDDLLASLSSPPCSCSASGTIRCWQTGPLPALTYLNMRLSQRLTYRCAQQSCFYSGPVSFPNPAA